MPSGPCGGGILIEGRFDILAGRECSGIGLGVEFDPVGAGLFCQFDAGYVGVHKEADADAALF